MYFIRLPLLFSEACLKGSQVVKVLAISNIRIRPGELETTI